MDLIRLTDDDHPICQEAIIEAMVAFTEDSVRSDISEEADLMLRLMKAIVAYEKTAIDLTKQQMN